MKTAFLGLGVMGFPMAGHLTKGGHEVTVYNRTQAKAETGSSARRQGGARRPPKRPRAPRSSSPASATTTTCAAVVLGREGAFAGMAGRHLRRPHHRLGRRRARARRRRRRAKGVGFLDAPVSGGQAGAENGQLTVMFGGDQAPSPRRAGDRAYARAVHAAGPGRQRASSPRWSTRSASPGWCRGWPRACTSRQGRASTRARWSTSISKGAAQSWQMENRGKTMVAGKFDFGFAVDWMRKDLGICLEEARRNGARLPVTAWSTSSTPRSSSAAASAGTPPA